MPVTYQKTTGQDLIPIEPGAMKRFRKAAAGMSQYELAKRAGISRSYISDIEAGRKTPRYLVVAALAKALGVTVQDLAAKG